MTDWRPANRRTQYSVTRLKQFLVVAAAKKQERQLSQRNRAMPRIIFSLFSQRLITTACKIVVVVPVCDTDGSLLAEQADWSAKSDLVVISRLPANYGRF